MLLTTSFVAHAGSMKVRRAAHCYNLEAVKDFSRCGYEYLNGFLTLSRALKYTLISHQESLGVKILAVVNDLKD